MSESESNLRSELSRRPEWYRDLWIGLPPWVRPVLLPVVIIALGFIGMKLLVFFRYTPPKSDRQSVAALVSTKRAVAGTHRALVTGYGTISPSKRLEVRPQVAGHVQELHAQLEVGGRLSAGEVYLQIDPSDYALALETAKASLERAKFELELEKGNQIVAEREWSLLKGEIEVSELGKELALRKPHLREKQASLRAAESQLEIAALNLERTRLHSPFDAIVLSESVEVGKYVSPQMVLAEIAAVDEFYVETKVRRDLLRWLPLSNESDLQSSKVRVLTGDHEVGSMEWKARLVRLLGDVDSAGRMAKLLISVKSPLDTSGGRPPLLLGTHVRVEVEGREEPNLIPVPQFSLDEGGTVWVVNSESHLERRKVTPLFSRDGMVFLRGDLKDGESVVTSSAQGLLEGMKVRIAEEGN